MSGSASRSRTLVRADSQPSVAVRRNACRIARSQASRSSVGDELSQPYSRGTVSENSGDRARSTSTSGFAPGLTRRKNLSMALSSMMTEVLLCSADSITVVASGGSSSSTVRT